MLDARLKFRHIQTFVEIARHKSVAQAAAVLRISQPAVTKTVRELEDVLGVALLERDGRGIKLSRYGEIFLKHAGATMTALRQAVDSVSQDAAKVGLPVRIGALPTVSVSIMPKAMASFLKEDTGSTVKIVTGENAVLLEQLRVGELDLVVGRLATPEKMSGFSFEHLYSERVRFVVRADHPLLAESRSIFERLHEFPVLTPTHNSVIGPVVDQFLLAHGVAPLPTRIETVSDAFGRAFLRMSDAIWIISEGVVAADIADGTLAMLPLDTADTSGPVGLTMRADTQPSLPLALLMQTIRETAGTL
ncbi:pca operon transcription factor PcaQ [Agrobacterium rosae]|uniref:HTH-type transcriptional regulator TtuA n=1 Tax=Agrobacterium rosae TaxID=1972867 RepID=A0AAE5RVB9_9HYPH|nr:pca operon transcription factor PcaQ [Agrobacterium rosae]KAA3515513.1 pca operon transcription factor PcaQ [Agrobacterium rosae]KAA3524478.1 pca operon transcription factor PcaQ [Agrobacterium rosae]MCM2431389.1 pca operon transcription factor PcaQ [Agrobacterium rosae]MDX8328945.1 pca operon transcription factor PcaQ [Agrobacterium rosae]MQB46839.1 pca operon transcription factor PcaQ [Agrobacterium rosae]